MLYNTLHNRWLRLVAAVAGEFIAAAAMNLFIVPLHLYSGGVMGVCQLIRTLLQDYAGLSFGAHDIAGILYFLVNIPILILAYLNLGRGLAARTIICTLSYSFFYSIIPVPSAPILEDYLNTHVFANAKGTTLAPQQADVDGFNAYITRYKTMLEVERKAVEVL